MSIHVSKNRRGNLFCGAIPIWFVWLAITTGYMQLAYSGEEPLKIFGVKKNLYAGYIANMNARDMQYHYVELNYKLKDSPPFSSSYHYCYFFDDDKNLVHREASVFLKERNSRWEEYNLRQDLVLEDNRGTLGFVYMHDLKFKYMVFVFGNKDQYFMFTYPKRMNLDEFDLSDLKP